MVWNGEQLVKSLFVKDQGSILRTILEQFVLVFLIVRSKRWAQLYVSLVFSNLPVSAQVFLVTPWVPSPATKHWLPSKSFSALKSCGRPRRTLPKLDLPDPVGQEKYTKGATFFQYIHNHHHRHRRLIAVKLWASWWQHHSSGTVSVFFSSFKWLFNLARAFVSFYLHIFGKKYLVVRIFVTSWSGCSFLCLWQFSYL